MLGFMIDHWFVHRRHQPRGPNAMQIAGFVISVRSSRNKLEHKCIGAKKRQLTLVRLKLGGIKH